MPLNMQPLSDKFGVAITNVDLSKDDQSLFNEIVDVFVKKQVLVFRNQHIEPQHQVAFSRRFGPLEMLYDEDQRVPGFPEIAILSNEKVDGIFIGVVAAGDFWHSDQSYRRETSLATFLYAHKLPKHGGDTEFADMHGAYESLPDDIKQRIKGRMGIHQRIKLAQSTRRGNPRGWRGILPKTGHRERAASDCPHPSGIGTQGSLCLPAFYRRHRVHGRC